MSMKLTIINRGEFESRDGTKKIRVSPAKHGVRRLADYLGHVPGGMVAVKYRGKEWIAHPHCFQELS